MDKSEEIKLKLLTSRLHGLAIANLETVMHLSTAMVAIPGLPDNARDAAQQAFDSINAQIKILQEIGEIQERR